MRRMAWLCAVVGLLVAASCGSKGSSSTATTVATTATTGLSISTTTVPTFSGSQNSKYCALARQLTQTINPATSNDPKALFKQFDSFAGQFLSLAPSQIKADANTVVNAIRQLETALSAVNYDFTKVSPAALAPLQAPTFTAAVDRINAYDTQVCGLTTTT